MIHNVNIQNNIFHKLFLTLLLLFAIIFSAISQIKVDMKTGMESPCLTQTVLRQIIGQDETGLYAISDINIVRYNKDFVKEHSKTLQLASKGKIRQLEYALLSNGKIFLFSSFSMLGADVITTLYVQTVDKVKLTSNDDLREVAKMESRKVGPGGLIFKKSKDKLLVVSDFPYANQSNEPDKIGLLVLDADMNPVWNKEVVFPYSKEKVFAPGELVFTENAEVLVTGAYFEEKGAQLLNIQEPLDPFGWGFNRMVRQVQDRKQKFTYAVKKFNANGEKEYLISLDNKFIRDVKVVANETDVICAGLYSDTIKQNFKGTFYFSFDAESQAVKKKSITEFPREFIVSGMTKEEADNYKAAEQHKGMLYRIDLREIVLREDNSIVLVGQEYFNKLDWNDRIGEKPDRMAVKESMYYKDILLISINNEGKTEWNTKIRNKHTTVDDLEFHYSYYMASTKDYMYFFTNENLANVKNIDPDKFYNYDPKRASVVFLVRVDKSGNIVKKELFNSTDTKVSFRPKVTYQVDQNTYLLFGQKIAAQRFFKLALE